MQNSSEVFKSNFDYYQRVMHKKLCLKSAFLDFHVSHSQNGAPFSYICCYSRISLIEFTKIKITFEHLHRYLYQRNSTVTTNIRKGAPV